MIDIFIEKTMNKYAESCVFDVCLVKVSGHKKGKILINKDNIIFFKKNYDFFKDNPISEEKCIDSLFKPKIKKGQKLLMKIVKIEL